MVILGIETSCDETAAAVVTDEREILSSVVLSQIDQHSPYGGVVPEIASRSHVEALPMVIAQAMANAGLEWSELDAVAVTHGPGLASSLLVGVVAAKALSARLGKPLIGVNHLAAHLYAAYLGDGAPDPDEFCPFVGLLVSGGHTCLLLAENTHTFRLLGQTLDDAAGEALDKGASLMGLEYPGGPAIEKAARGGNPEFASFPHGLKRASNKTMVGGLERNLCFSFSGVKTALRYYLQKNPDVLNDTTLKDVAASYQAAVLDALVARLGRALDRTGAKRVAGGGGVMRNGVLRQKLQTLADQRGIELRVAHPDLCTDNAAMIAALAGSKGYKASSQGMSMNVDPGLSVV